MQKQLFCFLVTAILVGCGEKPPPQVPKIDVAKDKDTILVPGPEQPHHLPFKITAIHEKRKLSTVPPFHADGGEWTFFDCETDTDSKTFFTIGLMAKNGKGGVPIEWGRTALIVKDQEAGARFVQAFGKSFSGKMPT